MYREGGREREKEREYARVEAMEKFRNENFSGTFCSELGRDVRAVFLVSRGPLSRSRNKTPPPPPISGITDSLMTLRGDRYEPVES